MTNPQVPDINNKYNLEERTAKFGENVLRLCRKFDKNTISIPLINQVVKSGTSVGANYCEADDAESKLDFKHKIGICKKESRETKHFLRMLLIVFPKHQDEINRLWNESRELNLIFNSIYNKVK